MIVVLSENQLEEIIEALEQNPEQVKDDYSTLNYLKKLIEDESWRKQPILDDIPF